MWKQWVPTAPSAQRSILLPDLSGSNAYSHWSGRWHNVACLLSPFVKSKLCPGIQIPCSDCLLRVANCTFSTLESSCLNSETLSYWNGMYTSYPCSQVPCHSAQTHTVICASSLVFSVVFMSPPTKKVTLSVDSWITKGQRVFTKNINAIMSSKPKSSNEAST